MIKNKSFCNNLGLQIYSIIDPVPVAQGSQENRPCGILRPCGNQRPCGTLFLFKLDKRQVARYFADTMRNRSCSCWRFGGSQENRPYGILRPCGTLYPYEEED